MGTTMRPLLEAPICERSALTTEGVASDAMVLATELTPHLRVILKMMHLAAAIMGSCVALRALRLGRHRRRSVRWFRGLPMCFGLQRRGGGWHPLRLVRHRRRSVRWRHGLPMCFGLQWRGGGWHPGAGSLRLVRHLGRGCRCHLWVFMRRLPRCSGASKAPLQTAPLPMNARPCACCALAVIL